MSLGTAGTKGERAFVDSSDRTRLATVIAGMALTFLASVFAQQTSLTPGQLQSAASEVPRIVELLGLNPGMTVADVGAGFGAWTMGFARWTGPSGQVFSTDVGKAQLAALRETVKREGLGNVTVLEGGVSTTNLPSGCCDAILVRDAYHHFTEPEPVIRSLASSLKPGGRLAIVDFPPRPNSGVPEGVPENRGGHGVPAEVVVREVGGALTHIRTIPDWSPSSEPAGLYLVIFQK